MAASIKIGITHGDINGVGYELILKTFAEARLLELFTPIIYGSSKSASYHRKALDYKPINFNFIYKAENSVPDKINFINCFKEEIKIDIGMPTAESGQAAYVALDMATRDLVDGKIDALVTLPINKDAIQSDTFDFPGHTEFLQARCGNKDKALMILANDELRVALVTTHLPISEVAGQLSKEKIVEKLTALNQSLWRDFRVENPRIAVLGLNPHAGENGLLGNEEEEIIAPAIKQAQDANILCAGPFAADGFFGTARYKEFDAVLAMYHDQGLIPFKTLAMDSGVNFTAGLPIVRTSPDHGTAYDIAGKDKASNASFLQSLYMAADIFKNRAAYDEARKRPLRKMFFDQSKDDEKLDLTKEDED